MVSSAQCFGFRIENLCASLMSHLTVSLVLSGKCKPGHPECEPADGPPPCCGAAAHPDCEGNVSTKVNLNPFK